MLKNNMYQQLCKQVYQQLVVRSDKYQQLVMDTDKYQQLVAEIEKPKNSTIAFKSEYLEKHSRMDGLHNLQRDEGEKHRQPLEQVATSKFSHG